MASNVVKLAVITLYTYLKEVGERGWGSSPTNLTALILNFAFAPKFEWHPSKVPNDLTINTASLFL